MAAEAVHEVAEKLGIEMPISYQIYRILYEGATPADAFTCFRRTHMDALVMGSHLVTKEMLGEPDSDIYSLEEIASQYGLD